MKKFEHFRSKKGFSLVELIIVIAIMVALVAVMAPSMVKYVDKARNAAMYDAAERCMAYAKACFGTNLTGQGAIQIAADPDTNRITVSFINNSEGVNTLKYKSDSGSEGIEAFKADLNFRENAISASDVIYVVRIESNDVVLNPQQADIYIEEVETTEAL